MATQELANKHQHFHDLVGNLEVSMRMLDYISTTAINTGAPYMGLLDASTKALEKRIAEEKRQSLLVLKEPLQKRTPTAKIVKDFKPMKSETLQAIKQIYATQEDLELALDYLSNGGRVAVLPPNGSVNEIVALPSGGRRAVHVEIGSQLADYASKIQQLEALVNEISTTNPTGL